jgi:hypothetical protein
MALSWKQLRKLPRLAAGACLLIFVYYLFSPYARLAYPNATEQNNGNTIHQSATTQKEAGVQLAGAAVPAAPQAAVAASPLTMSTATQMLRPMTKIVEGMRLSEGAGVQIRRTVSYATSVSFTQASASSAVFSMCLLLH